jgi:hypothetical protein
VIILGQVSEQPVRAIAMALRIEHQRFMVIHSHPGFRPRRLVTLLAACTALIASTAPVASAASAAGQGADRCPHLSGRVVCVDQDHQRLWVQEGSKIIFPPVLVRTGAKGMHTPNGSFRVYVRHEWPSSPLLPYSQFFHHGDALHGSRDDLRKGMSRGCVNLTVSNARRLWGMLAVGDLVHIWGHKPGT